VNLSAAGDVESHQTTKVPSLLICVDKDSSGAGIISIEQSRKFPHDGSGTPWIFDGGDAGGSQSLKLLAGAGAESQSRKCHHSGRRGGADEAGDGNGSIWTEVHPRCAASGTQIKMASSSKGRVNVKFARPGRKIRQVFRLSGKCGGTHGLDPVQKAVEFAGEPCLEGRARQLDRSG
jgi:hypothetical protein